MSNIAAMSRLGYFAETTQGTPPASAAAWDASGVLLRHIAASVDISGVQRTSLEDERNQVRIFATEQRVEGLDNPEFPVSFYGHGLGVTTAAGSQINDSPATTPGIELFRTLSHCLGGLRRGYSNAVTGGTSTTTVVAVTDASDHLVGDFLAVEFATTPRPGYPTDACWVRRITATDTVSTPNTVTFDEALPAAPEDTDPLHACAVAYIDQSVLCDSNGSGGPYTRSWIVQKGLPGATAAVREAWVFKGCVSTLQQFGLDRDQQMVFPTQVMAGSHDDPTTAPWPTWTISEYGLAPIPIGPLSSVWLEDFGTTTETNVHVSQFSVEPGVPRTRTETVTSLGNNMQGTASYAASPAETTIEMQVDPFTVAQWTDQLAGTYKSLRWAYHGAAGSGLAVHFERVSHMQTPGRAENGSVSASKIMFKAHEGSSTATELRASKLCIVGW